VLVDRAPQVVDRAVDPDEDFIEMSESPSPRINLTVPFQIAGADPITVTFSWLLSLGAVALIAILILTAASIIAFFARTHLETNVWKTKVAPAGAAAGFLLVVYLALTNYDALLGGQGGTAQWLLLLIPIAATLGFLWATVRPTINYQAELV
jgi:hypothetical protein